MKTIKTTIATTLPDQVKSKFTKEALAEMRDQINDPEKDFFVTDVGIKQKLGVVKKASIPEKDLVVTMKLDDKLIDKSFEWFFVPFGIPIDIKIEGDFEVTRKVDLVCIKMVKAPTDLSLKPVRFEMKFAEGVDYFVKQYDELTPELVSEFIEKGNQVCVYYPESFGWENIVKDALERGIVINEDNTGAKLVFPFSMSVSSSFKKFKKQIDLTWRNYGLQKQKDPLLKHIETQ